MTFGEGEGHGQRAGYGYVLDDVVCQGEPAHLTFGGPGRCRRNRALPSAALRGKVWAFPGTGRFAGTTGGGPTIRRTSVGKLGGGTAAAQGIKVEGIAFWRELKYRLP